MANLDVDRVFLVDAIGMDPSVYVDRVYSTDSTMADNLGVYPDRVFLVDVVMDPQPADDVARLQGTTLQGAAHTYQGGRPRLLQGS